MSIDNTQVQSSSLNKPITLVFNAIIPSSSKIDYADDVMSNEST